jgi:hypothetical protein
LEAATGRKAGRRRRWSGVEEKGSGRDREVVAIAAAATDSMDGERARGQRWGAAGVRFFISFLKERVRISGGWTPLAHLVGFRIFPFVEI